MYERQPVARLMPFANVDEPVVMLSAVAESPPAKVDVPWPAPTVMAAANVEVAVVEVANTELKKPCAAEIWVDEAPEANCCKALKVSEVEVALLGNG